MRMGVYYCSKCGMIWDPVDQQQQRVIKSQEKSRPRIPKPSDDFFFESIPSNLGLKPKHIECIPIQKVNEAYERVVNGDVRYRFVIDNKSL